MNKKQIFAACAAVCLAFGASAETFTVKSPDGRLEASLTDGAKLLLSVSADGKVVMDKAEIAMSTSRGELGPNSKNKSVSKKSANAVLTPVYGIRSEIKDKYNEIKADFGGWSVYVRAYDDAVAYRFATDFGKEDLIVSDELLLLPFADDAKIVANYLKGVMSSYEELYVRDTVGGMKKHHSAALPLIVESGGVKIALVESALKDYPALRIAYPAGSFGARSMFSKYPKTFRRPNNFMIAPDKLEDFIAKTKADRKFPWRAFIIARTDADLADNDTVYKLADPSKIEDTSWIETGTCAWDWWNHWNLEGVDFVTGVNEQTYTYIIDFAAENNIPFILMDAGWLTGSDVAGMKRGIDESLISGKAYLDMESIISYAHSKNVKVILWVLGNSLNMYCDKSLDIMKEWGADGVKVDFFDRDDQTATELYERIARSAAKREMLVDFHGCAKPAGLQRVYPNVVNFEAVRGNEYNKFSPVGTTPSHNIDLIFTRMLQGPMDYTPGGMDNVRVDEWRKCSNIPQVMGTRAHQVAMYVLFYAPIQMLSDRATEYKKYPDILRFIANAPTTWDDTKVLEAKIGELAVIARRKGDVWYIGGMTDWNERKVSVDLSKILPAETIYKAEIIRDSANCNKLARDYRREVKEVSSADKLSIIMRQGGGFAVKLTPKKLSFFDDVVKFFTED